MPQQTGALREVLLADVAFVRPYAGMGEHMLVKIANGQERFLAQDTSGDIPLAVLETFVTRELASATILLAANLAFKAFPVLHQMIVQSASVVELLAAQVTRIFILDLAISLLMSPLVVFDVLDLLAAEAANLQVRHVGSLHMMGQIDLQLVTTTTMFANVSRFVIAVGANAMSSQSLVTFVFHITDLALEEIVRQVYSFVRRQRQWRVTSSFTLVALIWFTMYIFDMSLNFICIVELLLAKWTCISYIFHDFVHFSDFFGGFFGGFFA